VTIELFVFLDGITPWWWVGAALLLAIVEVLSFSFFLIWPALAALAVAITMWLVPGLSGTYQVLIFAVLSVIFTLAGRHWVLTHKAASDRPDLNNRAAQMVGRRATALETMDANVLGSVEVDGIHWRGRLTVGSGTIADGASLRVVDADGMVLILEAVD